MLICFIYVSLIYIIFDLQKKNVYFFIISLKIMRYKMQIANSSVLLNLCFICIRY